MTTQQTGPDSPVVVNCDQAATNELPRSLLIAGGAAWRVIAILVAAWMLLQLVGKLSSVLLPVAMALILAALLSPIARRIRSWVPINRHLLAAILVISLVAAVAEVSRLAGAELVTGMSDLQKTAQQGLDRVQIWLRDGDLGFGGQKASDVLNRAQEWLQANEGTIIRGALSVGGSAASFVTGLLVALVSAFFFLADGRRIWTWFISLLPRKAQGSVTLAFDRGWASLESYARTQVIVALVDAIGIGLGALVLGVPFVMPIAVIVFLTAFIPILGAFLAGIVAVLVALVFKGFTSAVFMFLIVLAVQQLEGNVLQPILMGRAVSLHPWATIIGVTAGGTLMGIAGALFAVPLMALTNTVVRSLYGRWQPEEPSEPGRLTRLWHRLREQINEVSESR